MKGKITVVTGAGSGIGRAMALRFAEEGARVLALDITGNEQAVAKEAKGEIIPMHCDVSDHAAVAAVFATCRERFGRLDVLCNNAGTGIADGRLHETRYTTWDKLIAINLSGAFSVLKEAIPLMLDSGGGAIVNTGSTNSFRATPGTTAYGVTKAGIMMLTQQIALEYATDNIRANAICPGLTRTPLVASAPAEIQETLKSAIPMKRMAEPIEIANVALFLASDEASYINGHGVLIDGGVCAG